MPAEAGIQSYKQFVMLGPRFRGDERPPETKTAPEGAVFLSPVKIFSGTGRRSTLPAD
jgi:hypothetical protein